MRSLRPRRAAAIEGNAGGGRWSSSAGGGRTAKLVSDSTAVDDDDGTGEDGEKEGERPRRLCMTSLASADCFDCLRPASVRREKAGKLASTSLWWWSREEAGCRTGGGRRQVGRMRPARFRSTGPWKDKQVDAGGKVYEQEARGKKSIYESDDADQEGRGLRTEK